MGDIGRKLGDIGRNKQARASDAQKSANRLSSSRLQFYQCNKNITFPFPLRKRIVINYRPIIAYPVVSINLILI